MEQQISFHFRPTAAHLIFLDYLGMLFQQHMLFNSNVMRIWKRMVNWSQHIRGEGGYLDTGVSWHNGRNTHWQRKIAAISNLYSTVASSVNGQQASVLCEL